MFLIFTLRVNWNDESSYKNLFKNEFAENKYTPDPLGTVYT